MADLAAIEARYGLVLPDDYKAHVLRHNGGRPTRRTFVQPDAEHGPIERKLRNFYPVKHGDDTLEDALKSLRDQLHPDLVPFGEESGGDQFVLSVGPEDYGSVYYVAHEFYQPPFDDSDEAAALPPRQYGEGVYFLAPSFSAYVAGLGEGQPV